MRLRGGAHARSQVNTTRPTQMGLVVESVKDTFAVTDKVDTSFCMVLHNVTDKRIRNYVVESNHQVDAPFILDPVHESPSNDNCVENVMNAQANIQVSDFEETPSDTHILVGNTSIPPHCVAPIQRDIHVISADKVSGALLVLLFFKEIMI